MLIHYPVVFYMCAMAMAMIMSEYVSINSTTEINSQPKTR